MFRIKLNNPVAVHNVTRRIFQSWFAMQTDDRISIPLLVSEGINCLTGCAILASLKVLQWLSKY